ncbi:type II toxin-antitoxin system YafQ family toxin [Capnocytophaga sp. oral taxon 324]|uniref:type II toxin-antitoxin system YafQ family toxin n=1 Tax=Capnocytophaga sp. oral taxon 324 TaxID=712211 RepID=UPI0002A40E09|nr:type II toxin-antitoxin system YafQ family toxin [Capnocytophaga sp. oral taxon 324]EKY12242.1 addiction module toxin, RelE/StbE family [Capnocytophaga sp. oral taxon 324 str. F0483]
MNDTKENKDLYRIVYATTFKKELKKYKNQPIKLSKIIEIINILIEKGSEGIPMDKKPHLLTGNYKGCMECHIEPDLLLIWEQDDTEKTIMLDRIGSHSELFYKNKK